MQNSLKLLFILICSSLSYLVVGQTIKIRWNSLESEGLKPINGQPTLNVDDAYYTLTEDTKTYSSNPSYYLVKLDNNLYVRAKVEIPAKQKGVEFSLVSFIATEDEIIVIFKYFATIDYFTLVKASFNYNLSNALVFQKIEDIPTQSILGANHNFSINHYNTNKEAIILKTPREAYPKYDKLILTAYNNSFSKKEWSSTLDLSSLIDDYVLKSSIFTEDGEFVFLMQARLKAFAKIKNNMLLCKYSKEKGLQVNELHFEKNELTFDYTLYHDTSTNFIYVYGILELNKSKKCNIFVKKCSFETLKEVNSFNLDLGTEKECGLLIGNSDYKLYVRGLSRNNENGVLTFTGEMYTYVRESKPAGYSGNILRLHFNDNGQIIRKIVIPRKLDIDINNKFFSSYIHSENDGITKLLFYDHEKNANQLEYNRVVKTKAITANIKNDLYMVIIDENYNIAKHKVEKKNSGKIVETNKFQNFEIYNSTYFPLTRKYFVKNEMHIGIMSVE